MTRDAPASDPSAFDRLMATATAGAPRFGHREHVHLTWLAVRRFGPSRAVEIVSEGIQRTARYAGAPQKYNATVSRAWVELVAHHVQQDDGVAVAEDAQDAEDFAAFAGRHPPLLDKRLLTRFYRPATLASTDARAGWVEPDLHAFPWVRPRTGAQGPDEETAARTG